jgi:hypothetical protein
MNTGCSTQSRQTGSSTDIVMTTDPFLIHTTAARPGRLFFSQLEAVKPKVPLYSSTFGTVLIGQWKYLN